MVVEGNNFEATPSRITIFDWSMTLTDGIWKDQTNQIPEPYAAIIESELQNILDHGKTIDHILVSEFVFAILYSEGKVTFAHMKNANERDDTVIVPQVVFLEKEYTVRVMDSYELDAKMGFDFVGAAFMDADGKQL